MLQCISPSELRVEINCDPLLFGNRQKEVHMTDGKNERNEWSAEDMDYEDEDEHYKSSSGDSTTSDDKNKSLPKKLNSFIPDNDFYCTGAIESLPFITIGDDRSDICKFPCVGSAATELISHCEEAPFGRGEETLYDKTVRNGWQLTKISMGYGE